MWLAFNSCSLQFLFTPQLCHIFHSLGAIWFSLGTFLQLVDKVMFFTVFRILLHISRKVNADQMTAMVNTHFSHNFFFIIILKLTFRYKIRYWVKRKIFSMKRNMGSF